MSNTHAHESERRDERQRWTQLFRFLAVLDEQLFRQGTLDAIVDAVQYRIAQSCVSGALKNSVVSPSVLK